MLISLKNLVSKRESMINDTETYSLKDVKLVSFGEIIFDRICEKYYLGGAPLNFAWYMSQMEANVSLVISAYTADNGTLALNKIFSSGIEPIVTRNGSSTGLVDVQSDGTFTIHKVAAGENIPPPFKPKPVEDVDPQDLETRSPHCLQLVF